MEQTTALSDEPRSMEEMGLTDDYQPGVDVSRDVVPGGLHLFCFKAWENVSETEVEVESPKTRQKHKVKRMGGVLTLECLSEEYAGKTPIRQWFGNVSGLAGRQPELFDAFLLMGRTPVDLEKAGNATQSRWILEYIKARTPVHARIRTVAQCPALRNEATVEALNRIQPDLAQDWDSIRNRIGRDGDLYNTCREKRIELKSDSGKPRSVFRYRDDVSYVYTEESDIPLRLHPETHQPMKDSEGRLIRQEVFVYEPVVNRFFVEALGKESQGESRITEAQAPALILNRDNPEALSRMIDEPEKAEGFASMIRAAYAAARRMARCYSENKLVGFRRVDS